MKELPPMGVAGAFIESYRVWCNFYGEEPSEELIQYCTDSVERTPYILDLSYCPGIEPGTNITFNLQPVFQALRYNSYFLGMRLCDVVAKGAMELLAPCLKCNRVLTRLHLRNLTTTHLTLIGHALAENGPNSLQEIDLSGTHISEKACRALALSMVVKEYGLRCLDMSKCELTAKSIGVLFREGFLPSPEVTIMLEELNLSDNKFDEEASLLVQVWMSKIGRRGQLRKFNIARTSASLGLILPALEGLGYIEEVNVSGCPIDLDTAQSLARVIAESDRFHSLDVSHCNLAPSSMSVLLAALLKNPKLTECKINLAGNTTLDDTTIGLLLAAITSSRSMHTLNLSQFHLGEASMLKLFGAIVTNLTKLRSLVLQDFFGAISGHIPGARIGHALADLVLQIPSLDHVDLSMTKTTSLFGGGGGPIDVLLPFIKRMQRNETLLELNLAGNRLADKLAVNVAEMLRCNTKLVSLNVDNNRITLTGFQALEYAMHRNRTLQRFEFPTLDVGRCVKSNMPTEKLTTLYTILSNIQLAVNFNQSNGVHEYLKRDTYEAPRSGPILTYEDQAPAPPSSFRAADPPAPVESIDWGGTSQIKSGGGYDTTDYSQNYSESYQSEPQYQPEQEYSSYSQQDFSFQGGQEGSYEEAYQDNYSQGGGGGIDPSQWSSYSYQNQGGAPSSDQGDNNDLFNALASVLQNDPGQDTSNNYNW